MPSMNRVFLAGNLTRSVEVRYIQSGTAVADVGIAVNEKRKDKSGEWVETVVYADITFWGRMAEVLAEYCKKGDPILVEGRLQLDQWEQEGQKRSKLKVIGERMQMLSSKGGGGGGGSQDQYSEPIAKPRPQPAPSQGKSGMDSPGHRYDPNEEEPPF